ncbi:hypothetical protein SEA_IBANTIK_48 [Streptomyces phage Ibantik]|uniref:Uncharacterized protein n=1 Tax=Streptomyces phage Ibantik TaxID=2182397 RepID=A0A2U8UNR6_9CAUD|nr:hypothetical protein QEH36_gp048 [Streptomyces phage Ibantik]AWN05272.1 hypothetical protein SEA_IBANTIK_48 [Streptomyces phage Ibantik]
MRVYRKTATQHPFCIYLTDDEMHSLSGQLDAANLKDDWFPTVDVLRSKLWALRDDPDKERA